MDGPYWIVGNLGEAFQVVRYAASLVCRYPADILSKGGFWYAMAVEEYHQHAAAIGVPRDRADRVLAESCQELSESPRWFDPVDEARDRLNMGDF